MMRRECRSRQKHGFNVELLERGKLRDLFSLNAPCAILNHDAAEVNPRKLTQSLVRTAQRKGPKVFAHTTISGYRRQGKRSLLTTEDGFQIQARHVVFATGYESQQFLKQKAVRLVSSYGIASTPRTKFPASFERPVIWNRRDLTYTCALPRIPDLWRVVKTLILWTRSSGTVYCRRRLRLW
jgi:glycine/D-amino acid oxidase-like deaminating enzyme